MGSGRADRPLPESQPGHGPVDRSAMGAVANILALAFIDELVWSYAVGGPPRRRLRTQVPFFHELVRGDASFSERHGARLGGRLVGARIGVPPGR